MLSVTSAQRHVKQWSCSREAERICPVMSNGLQATNTVSRCHWDKQSDCACFLPSVYIYVWDTVLNRTSNNFVEPTRKYV